ncbi:uncharacterized protein V6R79_025365 [Siganus canaliculatus]
MKETAQYNEKTPKLSVVTPRQDTLINGPRPIKVEPPVIKEMKAAMAADLQKATLHACSALDPRFKSLPFLTENERQDCL